MLSIRPPQLAGLAAAARESYVTKVLKHLRQRYPLTLEKMGEEEAAERIRYGAARAESYRFSGVDGAQFVELTFLHGLGFDEEPWAREILSVTDASEADIARHLYEAGMRRSDHPD